MIAFLTLELHIEAAQSLKDKRRVLRSLKDRLRNSFNVSVAELDASGLWNRATVGVVAVSALGLEREARHKSAGLRTYTVVGTSAALFLLISKYGFTNILEPNRIVLDPSRVAAQIVTGIGFIGAGLIFVQNARDQIGGLILS